MILMRTDDLAGKYCDIKGGSRMAQYKYGEPGAGWFPVESVQFGFQGKSESSVGGAGSNGSQQSGGSGGRTNVSGGRTPSAGAGRSGSGASGGNEEFTVLSVSRFVDRASVELMDFAMQDRKVTKADKDKKMRKVDIHFLHSVHVYKGDTMQEDDQYVYPYLMITLDRVLLKSWNISSQADDRPTETFEMWYDKAAMQYHRTKDGKEWIHAGPKGWDQYENKSWTPSESEYKFFKRPPN